MKFATKNVKIKEFEPAILIPIEALNEKCPEDRKIFTTSTTE